jgi:hypothetical protein
MSPITTAPASIVSQNTNDHLVVTTTSSAPAVARLSRYRLTTSPPHHFTIKTATAMTNKSIPPHHFTIKLPPPPQFTIKLPSPQFTIHNFITIPRHHQITAAAAATTTTLPTTISSSTATVANNNCHIATIVTNSTNNYHQHTHYCHQGATVE